MKKVILGAIAALAITAGAAFSEENKFYAKETGQWLVEGIQDGDLVYCAASTFWPNGSFFTFYITDDDRGNIIVHNTQWNIGDPVGHFNGYQATFSFFGDIPPFQGKADYELQDAQTIVIPNVNKSFYEQWIKYNVLSIVMPGDITKMDIGLKGTTVAISNLGECLTKIEKKSTSNGQSL